MKVEFDVTCPNCSHTFKELASNMDAGKSRA